MQVNPAKHPNVKRDLGQQFISAEGPNAIAGYQISGRQLFYPERERPKGLNPIRRSSPNWPALGPDVLFGS
jgi:hypothetical protein